MDDAIDQMNATGKSIELYELTSFEPQMRDMTGIIVEAARVTAAAIPLLRRLGPNAQRLHALTSPLIQLEGPAAEIHELGLQPPVQSPFKPTRTALSVGHSTPTPSHRPHSQLFYNH